MGSLRLLCRRWVLQLGCGSVRTGRWRWARTKILCKNMESECAATAEKLPWLICPRSCSILAWCTARVKHGYGESLAKEIFLFGEDALFRVKEFSTTLIYMYVYVLCIIHFCIYNTANAFFASSCSFQVWFATKFSPSSIRPCQCVQRFSRFVGCSCWNWPHSPVPFRRSSHPKVWFEICGWNSGYPS